MNNITENRLDEKYDIAIIGGGINGAGIALEAILRGYKTVVIDKSDFGSFTTSASTKLIHGGLRYLEYYEFPLVRESLRERERLLKNAPHLVKPLKLNVPVYEHSPRGPLTIKAGMILYDILSYDKSLPNHKMKFNINKEKFREIEPSLLQEKLKALASYYDCQIEFPERLCLENILSANQNGACVLNHTKVTNIKLDNVEKEIYITSLLSNKNFVIKSKYIINAAGPFVDDVNNMTLREFPKMMGGTKGSHIIINRFQGGPKEALYIEAHQDGRPFFIIPWRNCYLVGTTDKFFAEDLDKIAADGDEVKYLLDELNYFMVNKKFTEEDVLYTYSGIRPLPYEPGKKERQVTRKHIIYDHGKEDKLQNYFSIVGGKLTTYRNLAEETINLIDKKERVKSESKTRSYKLFGAVKIENMDNYVKENKSKFALKYNLSEETVGFLIHFYGSKFKDVLKMIEHNGELRETLSEYSLDIKAQIVYSLENEMAKTLEDIIIRRTGLGTSESLGLDCVEEVAEIAADYLGWDKDRKLAEINSFIENVKFYYTPSKSVLNNTLEERNVTH